MRSGPLPSASSSFISRSVGGVVEVGRRVIGNYVEHRMGTSAVALAYRGLFALFPFLLLLVVLLGCFAPPTLFNRLVAEVKAQQNERVPEQLEPMVEQSMKYIRPLEEMLDQAQKQARGGLLVFSVAVALWSISALASTLADSLNVAYGVTETRRWWKSAALSLASGPIVAIAVLVAVVLMLTGTRVIEGVAEFLGMRELFVFLWGWLHYPVALVLLWVALSFIYRYSPAVTMPVRSVWLGAALAVGAWAITTVGFSAYLANFADYGVTYGSLGAAVGMLVYLNLSASIVLAGAELNATLHPVATNPQSERAGEPGSAGNKEISSEDMSDTGYKKRVAIACQGGGSHTAFTAGVLKGLLRPGTLQEHEVVALSGTSGGAVCALLAWHNLLEGDTAGAAEDLDAFWRDNSATAPHEQIMNSSILWASALQNFVATPAVSPYHNPFATMGLEEFRGMLERRVEFEKVVVQPEGTYPVLLVGRWTCSQASSRRSTAGATESPPTPSSPRRPSRRFTGPCGSAGERTGTGSSRRTHRSRNSPTSGRTRSG